MCCLIFVSLTNTTRESTFLLRKLNNSAFNTYVSIAPFAMAQVALCYMFFIAASTDIHIIAVPFWFFSLCTYDFYKSEI